MQKQNGWTDPHLTCIDFKMSLEGRWEPGRQNKIWEREILSI